MTVRWPRERTTPTCLVRTALYKSSQGTRLWERGTCGHLKVRRQTVLRDQEWKQPNSGELMCCEYVPWRLSLDASCHQKIVVRRLALSSFSCPKEPVFEACLTGSCDGARSFLLVQAQVLVFWFKSSKNEKYKHDLTVNSALSSSRQCADFVQENIYNHMTFFFKLGQHILFHILKNVSFP